MNGMCKTEQKALKGTQAQGPREISQLVNKVQNYFLQFERRANDSSKRKIIKAFSRIMRENLFVFKKQSGRPYFSLAKRLSYNRFMYWVGSCVE